MRKLAWAALGVSLAIFLSHYLLPQTARIVLAAVCVLAAPAALLLHGLNRKRLLLLLCAMAVGFGWYAVYANRVLDPLHALDGKTERTYAARVVQYPARYDRSVQLTLRLREPGFSRDPGVLAGLRERLERLPVTINSAFPFNIEVMDMGRGKGRALTFLADHYGLKKEELMAFGDGTNDLEMLLASGTPVAMANGEEALKKIAAIVAPGNAEDGEAQVIEKWVLM